MVELHARIGGAGCC